MNRVIVAGGSGLIGSELISQLLLNKNINEVVALVRTPMAKVDSKLIQISINFDSLESYKEFLYGDAIYCCLGSTKRKTPDLKDYRRVDFYYPTQLARISAANNIPQFHLISALGANAASAIFYTRLKGETEEAVKSNKFESIHIYQPSFLEGNRIEKRPSEKIAVSLMKIFNPLLIGGLKKYRSIKASTIAKAIINQTFKKLKGVHSYPSEEIKQLA